MSNPDRRRAQRVALEQAVSLVPGDDGHEVLAITANLSSAGVLLYADQFLQEGSEVGLIIAVPPIDMEAEGNRLWCFGTVVRVEEKLKKGKFGIAIRFRRLRSTAPGLGYCLTGRHPRSSSNNCDARLGRKAK